jgi:hypothetical protein
MHIIYWGCCRYCCAYAIVVDSTIIVDVVVAMAANVAIVSVGAV